MIQKQFIKQAVERIKDDKNVIGLAVAGSFITKEIDEFSDVDLILVTVDKVAPDFDKMEKYAKSFGNYLNGFTGEHVGERRVLICLYDNPLLHVDIKFITLDEFEQRVEDPIILFDRDKSLEKIITTTKSEWPKLDYQWIEDRFWIWVHYAALKLGRGENFEALDFLSFVRITVTSPLLQVKNGRLPRALRKVEFNFNNDDLSKLVGTIPAYNTQSIFDSLDNTIKLYCELRDILYPSTIQRRTQTETKTLDYLDRIKRMKLS
ncbi:nucleotidyltransferase domain-containing protein [Algoriphagus sp. Y33]|uniref:nucleotidyltransferase domain-containing protein n=1 Tax=Algoriphagus sp. Y33 TaxID=2772483 RepID=UPI001CE20D0B|nr:nucleotidyltransferase domain-containing protein [Algoriphagus sp. Y33]